MRLCRRKQLELGRRSCSDRHGSSSANSPSMKHRPPAHQQAGVLSSVRASEMKQNSMSGGGWASPPILYCQWRPWQLAGTSEVPQKKLGRQLRCTRRLTYTLELIRTQTLRSLKIINFLDFAWTPRRPPTLDFPWPPAGTLDFPWLFLGSKIAFHFMLN